MRVDKLSECIEAALWRNNFYLAFLFTTEMCRKIHRPFWEILKVYLTGSNIKEGRTMQGVGFLRTCPVTKVVPVWAAAPPLCLMHWGVGVLLEVPLDRWLPAALWRRPAVATKAWDRNDLWSRIKEWVTTGESAVGRRTGYEREKMGDRVPVRLYRAIFRGNRQLCSRG
jgi:hypothetical protein